MEVAVVPIVQNELFLMIQIPEVHCHKLAKTSVLLQLEIYVLLEDNLLYVNRKRVPKYEAINLGARKPKGIDVDDAILKTRGKEYQHVSTEDNGPPSATVNPREIGNLQSTRCCRYG